MFWLKTKQNYRALHWAPMKDTALICSFLELLKSTEDKLLWYFWFCGDIRGTMPAEIHIILNWRKKKKKKVLRRELKEWRNKLWNLEMLLIVIQIWLQIRKCCYIFFSMCCQVTEQKLTYRRNCPEARNFLSKEKISLRRNLGKHWQKQPSLNRFISFHWYEESEKTIPASETRR